MTDDPDAELMAAVARDDGEAFATLITRYQLRILRLMRTMVNDAATAEDLTQETFLRLYRARKRYRPTAKFSTYLYTIAGNVARNDLRRRQRKPVFRESDAGGGRDDSAVASPIADAAAASGSMPTRRIESNERAVIIRRAVETLPPRQRMALVLSRFDHLSYAEIAETMDLSTKAVKSLLSRARASLHERLRDALAADSIVMNSIDADEADADSDANRGGDD